MGLSTCHHLYENTACLSVKLNFPKPSYELSPWSQEPGGLSSTLNEAFGHHCWFRTGGAWGAGMLRKSSCIESGHDSELSVHPLKDPTADLQELHNLSLLIYESKKWQKLSLTPSVAGMLLCTVIEDFFKSGLNCVHKGTEDLSLSLLLLHLWPGKVTSVSERTAQTWFDKYQSRGNAVFIFKGFALRCFFSGSCHADSLPYQTSTWGASKQLHLHIILHQDWPWHYTWSSGWVLNPGRTKREGKNPTMLKSLKA